MEHMWIKAEMANLTVEEQAVVARCKLSIEREQKLKEEARARFKASTEREQLLKEVRERRDWKDVITFVSSIAILGTVLFYSDDQSLKHFASFAIFALIIVKMNVDATDRRFNALLELLELDRKSKDDSNNSKDEKVG
jgi:hypothetical protein